MEFSKLRNYKARHPIRPYRYGLVIAAVWTLLLGLSLFVEIKISRQTVQGYARLEARGIFQKDLTIRRWASIHGGVYAPITPQTPPNPYLQVPEREITTPGGKKLTLLNPAYLTRQINELEEKDFHRLVHITSLNPINPINGPDEWEKNALQRLEERKTGEITELVQIKGEEFMRLISPLFVEKSCLACHAKQGYKLGDIRGGISVAVPMSDYQPVFERYAAIAIIANGMIWVLGLAAIGWGSRTIARQVIQQELSEEELAKTNQELSTLFDSTYVAVALLDRQFNFIRVNRAYAEADHRDPGFYPGKNHFDLFPNPENQKIFQQVVDTVEVYQVFARPFQYAQNPERGTTYWDWTLTPLTDEEGTVQMLTLSLSDVTSRIQVLEALSNSERRYRELVEGTDDIICQFDAQGHFTFLNRQGLNVFGLEGPDAVGASIFEFIPAEYRERDRASLELWRASHPKTITYDNIIQSKDGETHYLQWTLRFNYAEDKALHHIDSIARDLTWQHLVDEVMEKNHQSVMEAEKRYHNLFNEAPGLYVAARLKNGQLVIEDCNSLFAKTLGYEKSQLVGQPLEVAYPHGAAGYFGASLKQNEDLKLRQVEQTLATQNGGQVPTLLSTTLEYDADGKLSGVLAMYQDLTEYKEAEMARHALERQLRQAQKLESIGTLAGGIAHDFNNILSAVLGYSELASMGTPKDSQAHDDLDEVLKAAQRAKDLIRQILTFSRQGEEERKPVEVRPIIKEALKLLRATLPATIEMVQQLEGEPVVLGDAVQIHQILMNLATNAGLAMAEKGGVLTVSIGEETLDESFAQAHPGMKPGVFMRLSVSDTGNGMSPDVMERIFDPFFSTRPKEQGTGLGLAVVHGIVQSYGGAITVQSQLGQGTTFNIYLPLTQREQTSAAQDAAPPIGGQESIMLVDDEEDLTQVAEKLLTSLGYRVSSFNKPLEALRAFQENPNGFDLLITDLTMPKMTGEALAEKIIALHPGLPVILCTGYAAKTSAERMAQLGVKTLLPKPFAIRELARAIRAALDKA